MTSNCKEFNFLIERKNVYSENDIPSLVSYNKCLTSEIDKLNIKTDDLEDKNQSNNDKIGSLEEQLLASKEIQLEKLGSLNASFNEKLAKLESTQSVAFDSYQTMFETSKDMYSDTLVTLSILIALAGIFAFFSLASYKKREVCQLADNALTEVKDRLDNHTEGLVANALDTVFVSQKLDEKLEDVATDVENRIMSTLTDRELFNDTQANQVHNATATNLRSILQD